MVNAVPSIAETYRLTKKPRDLPWNVYVCRPIAAALVAGISGTRITPNQLTLTALVLAMISAILLMGLPGYAGLVGAIVVFEGSYVLDCADGMLARLRNVQSVQGHLLDFLMDEIKAFALLAAATVRVYVDRGHDERFLLAGLGGLFALASGIAMTTFSRRPEIAGAPADSPAPEPKRTLVGQLERVAKLLIHYPSYIWIAALSGHLEIYFYPYIAVNVAYAGRTFLGIALRFGKR